MGKPTAQLPEGIDTRGDRIRIRFTWNGERIAETYPFPATPENIQRAGRLRREVAQRIEFGTFTIDDYRNYFPNSKRIPQLGSGDLFGALAQSWLDGLEVSAATRAEYKKTLNKYWMPQLAARPVRGIRPSELRTLIRGIEWRSAKTRNNSLIPLRGILEMAVEDELIDRNPMAKIKNQEHQRPKPDPFSREEMETILNWLKDEYLGVEAIHMAYFLFGFFTGMRTSEMLALRWSDIDFRRGYARVEKAQSKGRMNDRTKTAKVRDVLLSSRALEALAIAKPLTFLAGAEVFRSPRTGEAYTTEKSQRFVFTRALKKLGVRHRPAYNTRHTYATLLLMAGANPHFVAAQLGHSVTMTLTVYSTWIQGDSDRAELAKLEATL